MHLKLSDQYAMVSCTTFFYWTQKNNVSKWKLHYSMELWGNIYILHLTPVLLFFRVVLFVDFYEKVTAESIDILHPKFSAMKHKEKMCPSLNSLSLPQIQKILGPNVITSYHV
jgi:hypothetical protein